MTTEFDTKLNSFVAGCQDLINKAYTSGINVPQLKAQHGPKYVKVVRADTSVYCFINKLTGDVLKPASWSAPAKHARGNIFDASNGLKFMTAFGPAYLK